MSEKIDETIKALDNNIKNLEEAEQINLKDCQTLLLDLFGTIRDLWDSLKYIFIKAQKIQNIEQATEKGEKYEEKVDDEDIKRLYQ